jgi:hypothetical protein
MTKPEQTNPIIQRREKLLSSINRQIESIKRYKQGEKVRGLWFWIDDTGTMFLPIKYGKTVLELDKGKFPVECSTIYDVENSLDTVKSLTRRGSFDDILKTTSAILRSNFLK